MAVFDDQPVSADGLARLLAAEALITVLDVASRLPDFLRAVRRSRPDVIVFGVPSHESAAAARLARRLRAAAAGGCPRLVAVVSGSHEAADAWTGVASAVVCTDVTGPALCDVVLHTAADDGLGVPVELVRPRYADAPRRAAAHGAVLTAREREVLAAITQGRSTAEIASMLGISVNTARTHVQRLMAKLRVHSRLQASALAAYEPHLFATAGSSP